MIQVSPQIQILLAVEPVDFRKGIDSLVALCRRQLQADPFSGAVFVFTSKSRKALRLFYYDGQGFWICHKRLSKGRFGWRFDAGNEMVKYLAALQLQELIWNRPFLSEKPYEFRPLKKNDPSIQKTLATAEKDCYKICDTDTQEGVCRFAPGSLHDQRYNGSSIKSMKSPP